MNWPPFYLESSILRYLETDVPRVIEGVSVQDIAQRLESYSPGVVLMVDADNRLKGIITRSDLVKIAQLTGPVRAANLETRDRIVGISNTAQMWQLLKIMNGENSARRSFDVLPVLDSEKKPLGIIRRETLQQRMPTDLAAATPT